MAAGILDKVENSLHDFRPRNQREFVALQIARRFHDEHRLARYINASQNFPKKMLLEAARLAMLRRDLNRASAPDLFFEILANFEQGKEQT